MSTKIYSGIRFTDTDFHKLEAKLRNLRLQIMDLVRDKKAKFVAEKATAISDRRALSLLDPAEDEDRSPYIRAVSHLRKADENNYEGKREKFIEFAYPDYTFEIVIFARGGRFYGMSFVHDRDLEALLNEQKWIEEFGYWDNTDKPDSISSADWRKRKYLWDRIFDRCYCSVPANGGFTVNLSPRLWDYVEWDEIAKYLPDFEQRVQKMAIESASQAWSKERFDELSAKYGEKQIPAHEYMIGFGAARKTDPKWDLLISSESERIRQILPELITPQLLGFPEHRLKTELQS